MSDEDYEVIVTSKKVTNEKSNDHGEIVILQNGHKKGSTDEGSSSKDPSTDEDSSSGLLSEPQSILRSKIIDYKWKDLNTIWKRLLEKDGVKDQVAVVTKDGSMTFNEIEKKSNILASHLNQIISKPRSNGHLGQKIVAVFIPENDDRIITILALIKLEVIYVPLDRVLPKDRIRHILRDSGASVLLYQGDDYLRYIKDLNDLIILIDVDIILDAVVTDEDTEGDWDIIESKDVSQAVLCILYTSGSTGMPKGVAIRQNNLINRLEWQWRTLPWQDDDIGCHKTSLLFVDSLTEILGCLLAGRTLVVVPRFIVKDPDAFVDILHQEKVTRIILVPSLLQNIITYTDVNRLQSLNTVICSGEALPPNLAITFFEKCPNIRLVNLYGSTETTGDITYMMYTGIDDVTQNVHDGYIAVGKPVDNNDVYILNEQHQPLAEGEVGEIFLAGLNIIGNYITSDENTDCFELNPFSTTFPIMYRPGDYGVLRNGCVIYQGRQDSQIKIRGHRINLREIEQVLEEVPSIDDVSVITCPCRSGNIVVAFYTTNTRSFPTRKTLLRSIKKRLPSYMLPILVRLEAIPLQPQTGKVDRIALKRLYTELCEVTSYNLENDLENDLEVDHYRLFLYVIASELGVPESLLEPSLSFSDVGGNSLAAVAIVVRLNDLGFRIKVSHLLGAPSLGVLAESSKKSNKTDDLDIDRDLLQDDLTGYEIVDLTDDSRKQEIIDLMARGFVEKNPLDVIAGTTVESFESLMVSIWNEVIADKLSFFVVKSISSNLQDTDSNDKESKRLEQNGTVVAATISLDVNTKIDPHFDKEEVAEINDAVENPVKEKLINSSEKWIDCLLNAVDPSLPDGLSLSLLHMMETKLLDLAKKRGYHGIVTVNSHPVTMTVAERVFNYTVENTLHVKSFVWNEGFPFKMAPENYFIKAMTKRLTPQQK